jgi:uncharacterized membrane protein
MKRFLSVMFNGVMFAIPLGAVIFLFGKLLDSLQRMVEPLANAVGVQKFLGEFALLIVSVALIMLFCFVLGLLLQRAAILRAVGDSVEGFAVRVIPSLGFLRSMAGEKLDIQVSDAWKGILLQDEDSWVPAFLVEESAAWQTVFIPEAPKGDGGEVRVCARGSITFRELDLGVVRSALRVYGQGLAGELDAR